VIAVVSGKSGTGKSMIAANVACTNARDHRTTVAVVDLSLQFGDQALMFDAGSSPSMVDVRLLVDSVTDGIPLALSRPNSEWGQRVSALGKMMVATTSAADARKPKRGFLLGRSR
jgi:Flp pilus assembly CpaE family ATPase